MYQKRNNSIFCEEIDLQTLAQEYGTPSYVYSKAQLQNNINTIKSSFQHYFSDGLICYAVKANSNRNFIKILSEQGFGFDIVSGGELLRVLDVQGHANNVVYSGTAKTSQELELAITNNIMMINCESPNEVKNVARIATEKKQMCRVALRVNPAIDAKTHPHINTGSAEAKFGILYEQILETIHMIQGFEFVELRGLSCHIGSMIEDEQDYLNMIDVLVSLLELLKSHGISLEYLDLGGGYAIQYNDEKTINFDSLFSQYQQKLQTFLPLKIIIEPGRSIIGNAGALLSRVTYTKKQYQHYFMFLDAGMTELIRPALYQAKHKIVPITESLSEEITYNVGGPICESSDLFQRNLALKATDGDLILIENAGAYGYSMSSNYNTRPHSPEVLIDKDKVYLINKRQQAQELWQNEILHNL